MFKSVKLTIIVIVMTILILLSLFLFFYSSSRLQSIITEEKRMDFSERLRLIIDELQATSNEIESAGLGDFLESFQGDTFIILRQKYYEFAEEGTPAAYPIIWDKSGSLLMHPELDSGTDYSQFEYVQKILNEHNGEQDFAINGTDYWMVFRYFEDWDWFVAYQIPVSVKYASVNTFVSGLVIALLIAVLLSAGILIVVLGPVIRPLIHVTGRIEEIAAGEADLTNQIKVVGKDEMSRLSGGFNKFVQKLREIITGIKEQVGRLNNIDEQLATNSHQTWAAIEETSQTMSNIKDRVGFLNGHINESSVSLQKVLEESETLETNVQDQASAVNESSSAIEQMVSAITSVARITESRKNNSQDLLNVTREGKDGIFNVQNIIREVSSKMEEIQEIIQVITHINQQLNLLAMNAAIEAAHAGDAGKGFGVVSDEIRKLSEGTAENSRSIQESIKTIVDQVSNLDSFGEKTSQSFEGIETEVNSTLDSLTEIAQAMQEMDAGSNEVIVSLKELKSSTVKIGESTSTTRHLAHSMEESFSGMSTISSEVDNAVGEMVKSVDQINQAMQNVNSLVEQSKDSSDSVHSVLIKFKT